EDVIGIIERGRGTDVSRIGGDLGFDRGDLSLKGAAGIGVDQHAYGLPDLEVSAVLFRYGEVRVKCRQIGQRDDLRAGGQVLADFDMTDAEFAIERGAHQ